MTETVPRYLFYEHKKISVFSLQIVKARHQSHIS